MCGIVGYIGAREATPIILDGLKKLEYRGYDSAGIATLVSGETVIRRSEGKLINLEGLLGDQPLSGSIGIGHTRWATHGRPSEINAHPRQGRSVHRLSIMGLSRTIFNFRERLTLSGHVFKSETDTEVISHLLEEKLKIEPDFESAVTPGSG